MPRRVVLDLAAEWEATPWKDGYFPSTLLIVEVQASEGPIVGAS